jgi:hypothetical protein
MTAAEALLILILLGIIFLVVYYLLQGSAGRIAVTRPIESRIDEYLDQKFESLISEWSLTTKSKLNRFKRAKTPVLEEDEARIKALKTFETNMKATLDNLEERMDVLEKEMAKPQKGTRKKK